MAVEGSEELVMPRTGHNTQNPGPEGAPDMPTESKTEQVTLLDVAGDIASARLVTPEWTAI